MQSVLRTSFAISAALILSLALLSGCETSGDTVSLTIDPVEVDLTNGGTVTNDTTLVTFRVTAGLRTLSLPLSWRTTNPAMGTIVGAAGDSATYAPSADQHGVNSVIVTDQYEAEGIATVIQ